MIRLSQRLDHKMGASHPLSRFIVVPAVIVAVYAVTIIVLEVRWRRIHCA